MKYRHSKHHSSTSGFTLIELLVTVGLMSILMLVITDIFVSSLEIRTESRATSGIAQDGRFILARLGYDINRASAITTPVAIGNSGNSLTLTINGIPNTYTLSSNNFQLTNTSETLQLNSSATTVSNVTVQKLGNPGGKETVRISFTLTSTDRQKNGSQTQTFTTTIGRR